MAEGFIDSKNRSLINLKQRKDLMDVIDEGIVFLNDIELFEETMNEEDVETLEEYIENLSLRKESK